MIKLVIEDQKSKEQDYISAIKKKVMSRIAFLKLSIDHFEKVKIDLTRVGNSTEIVMRNAIGIIEGKEFKTKDDFKDDKYKSTVEAYLSTSNQLSTINFDAVKKLLKYLSEDHGREIENLLICPAEDLFGLNAFMMTGIAKDSKELKLLKLVFNYDHIQSISNKIRGFFRENNFINYCPYCNTEPAAFLPSENGNGAYCHELDHFFSQTDYPLLSYSLFNLVPSGSRCNSPLIKGSIDFSDEFNVNPYTDGFGLSARFFPDIDPLTFQVKSLEIAINCDPGSPRFKQLLGEKDKIDDSHKKGNLNIFKLRALYNDPEHIEEAGNILSRVHKAHIGHRSIWKYLDMMKKTNQAPDYFAWYKEVVRTPFYSDQFGERRDSKFNRDIHDYYFKDESVIRSSFKYVYNIIKKY